MRMLTLAEFFTLLLFTAFAIVMMFTFYVALEGLI